MSGPIPFDPPPVWPDDFDIIARALGESEAVRPAREALARIEAEMGAYDALRDTLDRHLRDISRLSAEQHTARRQAAAR